jgi:hypothetical protein
MKHDLTLTEVELIALTERVHRLNRLADRALEESNDRKAERLSDKADALDLALFRYLGKDDEALDRDDVCVIHLALERERELGNLDRA